MKMLFSLLIVGFFVGCSGQVGLSEEGEITVGVNENKEIRCRTSIDNPTYEWFYVSDSNYHPASVPSSDPRFFLTYPEPTTLVMVCKVTHAGTDYMSDPIIVRVVADNNIHHETPKEDERDPYGNHHITPPPTHHEETTQYIPQPIETSATMRATPALLHANSPSNNLEVKILNDTKVVIPNGAKDAFLLCKANFNVTTMYVWSRGPKETRDIMKQGRDPRLYIYADYGISPIGYRCHVEYIDTYDIKIITSEDVIVEVLAGQIQIQANHLLVAFVLLIIACVNISHQ